MDVVSRARPARRSNALRQPKSPVSTHDQAAARKYSGSMTSPPPGVKYSPTKYARTVTMAVNPATSATVRQRFAPIALSMFRRGASVATS